MLIDIHAHARQFPGSGRFVYDNFSSPEQLLERYKKIGITKAVLLPIVNPEVYEPQSNGEILDICRKYSDTFIPFCNIDPRAMTNSPAAPFRELLAFYVEQGYKGLGEMMPNLPLNDPLIDNLLSACNEFRLPVTFDMAASIGGRYGVYDEPGLPMLERALDRFPDITFLGHSPPFWAEIAALDDVASRAGYPKGPVRKEGRVPELMRKYPNLHGDLSAGSGYNAISRDPDYGAAFLEEFQDRLYYGTDICDPKAPEPPLAQLLVKMRDEKKISPDCYEKITWKNAVRLLGLKV
ncbi:MAG TPA: amidohydrolase family protein [Firmicutes bacterium]|nr:amidohydrolase family protein [Bacillota bacterium]